MGCDIHLRLEKKDEDGNWIDANLYDKDGSVVEFYNGRSYQLFGILANIRTEHHMSAIDECRGVPEDSCEETLEYMDCEDFHSATWFTYGELIRTLDKYSTTKYSGKLDDQQRKQLDKYGITPDNWCKDTTQEGYEYREWYSDHNSLKPFVEAFNLVVNMLRLSYKPDDIRVVIAFDN